MSPFPDFAAAVRSARPVAAIVLGSGMGGLTDRLRPTAAVSFSAIPGLTSTTVAGHAGRLTLGEWAGRPVLVFAGRLHFYEGHPWDRVAAQARLTAELGVPNFVLTNAAGGIHDALGPGSLMLIRDHIAWNRPYCWRQPGPGGVGPTRPSPYSSPLLELLREAAATTGATVHEGVYAAVTGPSYETPAEIRALRACGADAVGMSTAYEVEAGHDLGLACAAVSLVTNRAAGLSEAPLNHEEVLATAAAAASRLADLLEAFVARLHPGAGSR
jgi:purine-nucleoside phosphorylase